MIDYTIILIGYKYNIMQYYIFFDSFSYAFDSKKLKQKRNHIHWFWSFKNLFCLNFFYRNMYVLSLYIRTIKITIWKIPRIIKNSWVFDTENLLEEHKV